MKSSLLREVKLHRPWENVLEARDEVGRLGDMKSSGRNEKDMIGFDHAVLGSDRGAFHNEQVSLDAFP